MQYEHQAMRHVFKWQKSEESWRCDHVWVQEWPSRANNSREIPYPQQNKMIGELQLVFTVRDKDARGELDITHIPKYTRVMVKLL